MCEWVLRILVLCMIVLWSRLSWRLREVRLWKYFLGFLSFSVKFLFLFIMVVIVRMRLWFLWGCCWG